MLFLKKSPDITWQEVNLGHIKGWQSSPLLKSLNLKHLFTGKAGDLNLAKHQPTVFPEKSVEKNRESLCKCLELNYEKLIVVPISHTDSVQVLENENQKLKECDAVITHLTEIPILITAADCVPILLYSPEKRILGLVHAGWKGTCGKIVEKAVIAMQEHYMVRPSQIIAAIGPAIGRKNYEVGQDVADLLVQATESEEILDTSGPKPRADLKLANKIQLDKVGVMKIFVSELDTAIHTSMFYSHRIQAKRAGRQGLIACMVSN